MIETRDCALCGVSVSKQHWAWRTTPEKSCCSVQCSVKLRWRDPSHREKQRQSHTGNPGYWTGKKMSDEARKKMSIAKQQCPPRTTRSSKIERSLAPWLKQIGFLHTGDSTRWIRVEDRWKNPDYLNEDLRVVLELWGDYWHRGQLVENEIELYNLAGWHAIVIWESEVRGLSETQFFDLMVEKYESQVLSGSR